MKTSLKKALKITSFFLICVIAYLMGYFKNEGINSLFGNSYSVEYKVGHGEDYYKEAYTIVEVTVKGPAASLAVILTNPKGEPIIETIDKGLMLANHWTVEVHIKPHQTETWVLTVKTIDPEKVVWQKEITFSSEQVASRKKMGVDTQDAQNKLRNALR